MDLAAGGQLKVLEDAAQSHGATLGGASAGTLGHAGTFSFFPSKNLGAFGDGGALVTADDEIEAAARRLRFHGSADKRIHTEVGWNSRLDELQAAGLRVLLPHLGEWTAARRAAAGAYRDAGLGELMAIQAETDGAESAWHLFVATHPDRDALREGLAESGIETRPYYEIPLHRQPAMERWASAEPLEAAEQRLRRRSWRCRWEPRSPRRLRRRSPGRSLPHWARRRSPSITRRARFSANARAGPRRRPRRIFRAGTPTTTARASTSSVTTAPAATNASAPISTPGQIDGAAADPAGAAQNGRVERAGITAAHRVVVGRDRARSDEDFVLDDACRP